MKLIDEAGKCWRMFSVQAMVLAGAIQGAWEAIPADMKVNIPPSWVSMITIVLLALGIIGRLVDQPKVKQ